MPVPEQVLDRVWRERLQSGRYGIDPATIRVAIEIAVRERSAALNSKQKGEAYEITQDIVALFTWLGSNAPLHKTTAVVNGKRLYLQRIDANGNAYYKADAIGWPTYDVHMPSQSDLLRLAREYKVEVLDGWLGVTDQLLGEVLNEFVGRAVIPASAIYDPKFA